MIHFLATGGTIAMQRSDSAGGGGNVPALDARELLTLAGNPNPGVEVVIEDWTPLPAVHRGPAEMWALRSRVADLLAMSPTPTAIVVTHGTDTLEETAYLFARTIPCGAPIVLTGAMRTSSDAGWDGPRNLGDAFRVAADPESRGRGTMVVFAGRVFPGANVVKLDAFSTDAFGSPHVGALGTVSDGRVRFDGPASWRPTPVIPAPHLDPRVAVIPLVLGDDGRLLDLARPLFDGVVLEAFGRGNVPPGILPAVRKWLADGKPVVLASRCPFGEVGDEYGFEGGGRRLLCEGVLPAGPRPTSLARLELVLCLAAGLRYGDAS